MRDAFELWLAGDKLHAEKLLNWVIDRAEERIRRKQEREVSRKSAVRKLRLPGKLADCSQNGKEGSEIFIVEGTRPAAPPNRRATGPPRPFCPTR